MPDRAAMIATLIVDRPLCVECIGTRVSLPGLEVERALDRLRAVVYTFHEDSERCRGCGMVGKVFSLSQVPINPA